MSDNAEAPAGPDIVEAVTRIIDAIGSEDPVQYAEDYESMTPSELRQLLYGVRRTINYLRDANARLVAENTTLRAELRAARGEEGR